MDDDGDLILMRRFLARYKPIFPNYRKTAGEEKLQFRQAILPGLERDRFRLRFSMGKTAGRQDIFLAKARGTSMRRPFTRCWRRGATNPRIWREIMIRTENLRSGYIQDDVEEYLYQLLPARDAVIAEMEDYAAQNDVQIIGPAVARMLALFVQVSGAKRIF